jgi:SAM-dependent methyltransferase
MNRADSRFDDLIVEAERQPFVGWDFSYLRGRGEYGPTKWRYVDLVRQRLRERGERTRDEGGRAVAPLLDLGTGGGEVLSGLAPLPAGTVASEGYPPNLGIARARLEPLGVEVIPYGPDRDNADIEPGEGLGSLPRPDGSFALIISRHEAYYPAEISRLLEPGGRFITQQIGGGYDNQNLSELLGSPSGYSSKWTMQFAVQQLEEAGLQVVDRREDFPDTVFNDIGALAYYLKAVPWIVPGYTLEAYRDRLKKIHERIEAEGPLRVRAHFFYLEAENK